MNYEDYGIDEYYEQKEKEHTELAECGCILVVVLFVVAVVFGMVEAIYR